MISFSILRSPLYARLVKQCIDEERKNIVAKHLAKEAERQAVVDPHLPIKGVTNAELHELLNAMADSLPPHVYRYHCPYMQHGDSWFDDQGYWRPPAFCSAVLERDQYGEVDHHCQGQPLLCLAYYHS